MRSDLTGGQCVLVVDDESVVRMCVARALESAGYRVIGAGDGARALEILERAEIGIDLVLADINMPRLGGLELGRRITALGWPIPVLYMSANPPDATVGGGAGAALTIAPYLRKPFSVTTLITTVDRLLTARRAERAAIEGRLEAAHSKHR
jgi:CheY-like chemotaxis protein